MNPRFLPDLLIFLEVARAGSISKAARRLHTVQTNVSARMQKLEAALGSRLLTRTARGIDLTTAGETLLPVARRLDSLLGDLGQVFPQSGRRPPALIRIGSLETFAATHLAGLIASYHLVDPQLEFAITNGSSRSLVQMLQRDELDIAFVSYPASVESLRTEFTLKEELVLFAARNGKNRIDPQRGLASCQLPLVVQRPACSYSERFLSYLAGHGLRAPRTIEAGSVEALLGLVEQGLGFAIAPRSLIGGTARRIRVVSLRPLGDGRWINIHLISNEAGSNPALPSFVGHCRALLTNENHAAKTMQTKPRNQPRERSRRSPGLGGGNHRIG
jgi:DNA-binding transcriptional LysR family regulator